MSSTGAYSIPHAARALQAHEAHVLLVMTLA